MITHFQNHLLLYFVIVLLSSLSIALLVIPAVIRVARSRHLYDDLGNLRKIHNPGIPRLGGVAIFISFTITVLLALAEPGQAALPLNYILTACIMLFTIGLKDDLAGMGHQSKFLIELIAAAILVIPGDIRLHNLQNVFGIQDLDYFSSVVLSIMVIIFIINAFNLIDGIDGLAAATGILVNGIFSGLFIYLQHYELATVSLSLAGAILGFLKFNISPAKVFMGDTGSLLIGLISVIIAFKFLEISDALPQDSLINAQSSLGIVIAVLIGPVSDTLRVFVIRLTKGKSPFVGDRNHIHHRILQLGFSQLQTTAILILLNGLIILSALACSAYGNMAILYVVLFLLLSANGILTSLVITKKRKMAKAQEKVSDSISYNATGI